MLKGILLSSFVPSSLLKIGFPSSASNFAQPGTLAQRLLSRPRKKDSRTSFFKTQGVDELTYAQGSELQEKAGPPQIGDGNFFGITGRALNK